MSEYQQHLVSVRKKWDLKTQRGIITERWPKGPVMLVGLHLK